MTSRSPRRGCRSRWQAPRCFRGRLRRSRAGTCCVVAASGGDCREQVCSSRTPAGHPVPPCSAAYGVSCRARPDGLRRDSSTAIRPQRPGSPARRRTERWRLGALWAMWRQALLRPPGPVNRSGSISVPAAPWGRRTRATRRVVATETLRVTRADLVDSGPRVAADALQPSLLACVADRHPRPVRL